MDGGRFDDLARNLARRATRRGLLAGLAGAVAGLAAGGRTDGACPPGQVDRRGMGCVCKAGGRPLDASGFCPCPSGKTRCGDVCADLARDVAHCGACGAPCAAGPGVTELVCRQGACKVKSCAPGLANCDGDLTCETAMGTDAACAACGDACMGFNTCGGGGTPGACGCTSQTCESLGAGCGSHEDGCGGTIDCTTCPSGQTCVGGACLTSCQSSDDCIGAAFCNNGVCQGDKANGEGCDGEEQCLSGICVNGVCCDQVCDGACVSCASGACAPLATNAPCGGVGACQGHCSAAGECVFPGNKTTCREASCAAGVATLRGGCDGSGDCEPESNQGCSPYRCDAAGAVCLQSCANDDECEDEKYCDDASSCQWQKNNGDSCSSDNECLRGFCFQGVCSSGACLPATAVCTGDGQCCESDGAVCSEFVDPSVDRSCCYPLGAPCDDTIGSHSCCPVDGLDVSCNSIDRTCGGVGATCDFVTNEGETTSQCVSGVCCWGSFPFGNTCCTADGGACTEHDECAGGLCCGGVCITANEQRCGACDDVCNPDQQCIDRHCIGGLGAACETGDDCEDGYCYDGICCDACGVACGKPQTDDTPCGGDSVCCGGACTDVSSDAANCGSCSISCPRGDTCRDSACTCQQSSQCVVDPGGQSGHLEPQYCFSPSGDRGYCAAAVEGGLACIRDNEVCGISCTSSSQCGPNQVCSNSTCCGRRCHSINF